MPPSRWSRAALLLLTGLLGAGLADAALVAASPPFTWQADLATALGIAAVVAGGAARLLRVRRRARRSADPDARIARRAVVLWGSIGVAAVSFELLNYFLSPRRQHPTVSSLVADLTSHDVLRGLIFVAWLAAGCWVVWGEP